MVFMEFLLYCLWSGLRDFPSSPFFPSTIKIRSAFVLGQGLGHVRVPSGKGDFTDFAVN